MRSVVSCCWLITASFVPTKFSHNQNTPQCAYVFYGLSFSFAGGCITSEHSPSFFFLVCNESHQVKKNMNKRFAFLLIGGLVIPQTFWRERSEILKILRQRRTLFYSHNAIVIKRIFVSYLACGRSAQSRLPTNGYIIISFIEDLGN